MTTSYQTRDAQPPRAPVRAADTAFERIGGTEAVDVVVEEFFERVVVDRQLSRFFAADGGLHPGGTGSRTSVAGTFDLDHVKAQFKLTVATMLGATVRYHGRNLAEAHRGLRITGEEYDRMADLFMRTLWDNQVPTDVMTVVGEKFAALKPLLVEVFRPSQPVG